MNATSVQLTTTDNTYTCYPTVDWYHGQWPTTGYWYPIYMVTEPQTCVGKAHVFECDHEPKCKCGKVQRVMKKAKA